MQCLVSNAKQKATKKIQAAQNKCIRFCLNLNNRAHVGMKEFKDMNWLPTKERFEQCTATNVFKFFSNSAPSPLYVGDFLASCPGPDHSKIYKTNLIYRFERLVFVFFCENLSFIDTSGGTIMETRLY